MIDLRKISSPKIEPICELTSQLRDIPSRVPIYARLSLGRDRGHNWKIGVRKIILTLEFVLQLV
jgi:hypothetical protein